MPDYNFALLAHASGPHALKTANCRSLPPVFGRCELDAVSEIGNRIAVRVNLDLV